MTDQHAKVYTPDFKVTLYKRIVRYKGSPRFTSSSPVIDLTPLLGDGCAITTSKDVRQPFGSWSIVLQDQPLLGVNAALDSVYGIAEPMDYVEIRMARSPERYRGTLPVVMRGFVSSVRRSMQIGEDGQPTRRVIINGSDFGKIGQIAKIFLRADYETGNDYLTLYRLFARNGISPDPISADTFMDKGLQLLNGYVAALGDSTAGSAQVVPLIQGSFSVDASRGGLVSPLAAQMFDDTVWTLMMQYADTPWNELFIEDQDMLLGDLHSAPTIIYRPSPLLPLLGPTKPIMGGAVPWMSMDLSDSDIISYDYGRSDASVYNYFWVDPSSSQPTVNTQEYLGIQALAQGQIVDYGANNNPDLYGLRLMSGLRTAQFASGGYDVDPVTDPEHAAFKAAQVPWITQRRNDVRDMNRDNSVFESGSMTVKGDERFRSGRYLLCNTAALSYQVYVYGVTQTFVPFRTFRTSLTIERGTNFAARAGSQASPYFKEGAIDSYDTR